ncbi:MAG: hypothetical protein RSD49_07970 [Hafnia sp.]
MGQAKARGSKELRVAEGIEKRQRLQAAYEQRQRDREAAMTPQDREKRKRAQMLMATTLGLTLGPLLMRH